MSAVRQKSLHEEQQEDVTIARLAVEGQRARHDGDHLMKALLRERGRHMQAIQEIDGSIAELRREQERRTVADSILGLDSPRVVGMSVIAE